MIEFNNGNKLKNSRNNKKIINNILFCYKRLNDEIKANKYERILNKIKKDSIFKSNISNKRDFSLKNF